ncbi:MAG TPA: serine--tRNA ligase [Candidatus Saccharimonadales bacterium]|nr:serine--tRNA ligase [Candidatus Saccharimonadales bacterium]
MVDIKHLRAHPDDYQTSADLRGLKIDTKKLIAQDDKRLKLLAEVEAWRAELNVKGKPTPAELKKLQQTKERLEGGESELAKVRAEVEAMLADVPNLLAPDTPKGGEEANREEKRWGEAKASSSAKDHVSLAQSQGWLDFERAAKTSGNKFYFLKGPAVRLEMAVLKLVMDLLEAQNFTLISPPHLVNSRVAAGTGFLPRGEERQVYKIEDEDLYLIATAELPLTGYHADEILDPTKLPLKYAGLSPSYRREAGAYGKHSHGLYRVHQFDKLEMYIFCAPEDSHEWLKRLVAIEEEICQQLEIPYRLTRTAAGDMGAPHYQKYDLEYWSPVDNKYLELTSASNCTDFQARRLNIRTRTDEAKTTYVHTLNATAMAYSRIFIALIENHQNASGEVNIPQALRPYFGASTL